MRAACQLLFVHKPNPNHKPGFSVAVVVSAGFLKKVYSQHDMGLLNSLCLAGGRGLGCGSLSFPYWFMGRSSSFQFSPGVSGFYSVPPPVAC